MSNVPVSAHDLIIRLVTAARELEVDLTEIDLYVMINGVRFPLTRGNFQVDDDGTLLIDLAKGEPSNGLQVLFLVALKEKLQWYDGIDFVRMADVEGAVAEATRLAGGPEVLAGHEQVLAERLRQIHGEGFSEAHDDEHLRGELAIAAACYAEEAHCQLRTPDRLPEISRLVPAYWPWEPDFWKPSLDPRRNLVKANALIFAALSQIDRTIETELQEPTHD